MPDKYSALSIENIVSRLTVDLQELKDLKIDKPEIKKAIQTKEIILGELREYLEKNKHD